MHHLTHKDTIEVIMANVAALFISIQSINAALTTISLLLAITFTIYKFWKESKK
jgi:hypothetical protein